MSFNGVLKYIIYIFMGAWLFLLGVMAGRGTAPVTFETRGFQERLRTIVETYHDSEVPADPDGKIPLRYHDALSDTNVPEEMAFPVPVEALSDTFVAPGQPETAIEEIIVSENKDMDSVDDIPVKTSRKAATFHKALAGKPMENTFMPGEPEKTAVLNRYTIQVAAFKSFRDAVTQMATLEKKGFTATRTVKEMDGITWYRIRIGEFASRDAATRYLEQLNQAGINGIIITRD